LPVNTALPSLNAVRVFLAVARLGSTARAAEAVHLTQSAVSKQVQALEEHLGLMLFERSAQGLRLTEAGAIYRPYAEAALEQLQRGARRLVERRGRPEPIRLHMIAIVGERWLMRRFPHFAATHPDIDVQFTHYVSENETEDVDIDIRFGAGPWPGFDLHYLFGREIALVAAPSYIARVGGLARVADIQQLTLLQHFQMPALWAEFTELHGLRGAVPAHTIRYGYLSVIIEAAAAGLGAALVPRCFVRDELATGRLINPQGLDFESTSGCWLMLPTEKKRSPDLMTLTNWLISEAMTFDRET
jgi:LysR family glycine cleavage system transcriptional activator